MTWMKADRSACKLYSSIGLDYRFPICVEDLAARIFMPENIVDCSGFFFKDCPAMYLVRNGVPQIRLRAGLSEIDRHFSLAHEVAEHYYRGVAPHGYFEEDCNQLAGALVAPLGHYSVALREEHSLPALAKRFGISESCAALRCGEATGRPVKLVTPEKVRERGARVKDWESEPRLAVAKISDRESGCFALFAS